MIRATLLILALGFTLSACNTAQGFVRDVEAGVDAVSG